MRLLPLVAFALLPAQLIPADMIAPNPTPLRLALAPVALVGKVTSVEEKTIDATRFPGDMVKVPFQVAVVQVETGLAGTAGKTHVRVAFPKPVAPQPGEPVTGRGRLPGQKLDKDQEVLLFLKPHDKEEFLVAADPFGFVSAAGNPNFKTEVAEVTKTARMLAVPLPVLAGTDKAARHQLAALLIHKYRQPVPGLNKQEPIDATESKLLLTALSEAFADYDPQKPFPGKPVPGVYPQLGPQPTFFRLGLTEADGWKVPADFKTFPAAAAKWLADHAGTYRVKRFVPAAK